MRPIAFSALPCYHIIEVIFLEFHIDSPSVLSDYAALHRIPELGYQEHRTCAYLCRRLEENGIPYERKGETGILAVIRGEKQGPSLALRADMDALPFINGDGSCDCIHACGHDGHMAMVLNAGIALQKAGLMAGTVYLLFQPAEELGTGASSMIAEGLPHIDRMIGIHVRAEAELPGGKAAAALYHQAHTSTTVVFRGKAAHGARPHQGINALSAAACAITAVDAITLDTPLSWSAKATGADTMGNVHNIIPEVCSVNFDLRAETNELALAVSNRVLTACKTAAEKFGCSCTVSQNRGYAAEYDSAAMKLCEQAITSLLGETAPPVKTLGSEDFHAYHMEAGIPTAYMALGSDLKPGLHQRDMHFSPDCLPVGSEILYRCAHINSGRAF